jgi:hypothetical protein
VSFAKDNRRRTGPPPARFVLPPFIASPLLRLVAFALLAAIAAAWALARHYGTRMPPMLVPGTATPASAPAPTYDADAGEIPVPELAPWEPREPRDGG